MPTFGTNSMGNRIVINPPDWMKNKDTSLIPGSDLHIATTKAATALVNAVSRTNDAEVAPSTTAAATVSETKVAGEATDGLKSEATEKK